MKVSVIIPCYNAEPYLEQAIGSALCQTVPPKEIIVIDDGSADNSVAVARQFGNAVHVISRSNRGAARSRNEGASRATGEALMFLDADDVLGPNALEGLTAALQRRPGSIAVCTWYCLRKKGRQWVQAPPNRPPRRFGQDDLSAWLTGWFHTPCSVLWSRDAFQKTGGWDDRVTVDDDGDIMMRALIEDLSLTRATYGTAYYRRLPEDESSLSDARHDKEGIHSRMYVRKKIARLLEERGQLSKYKAPLAESFELIAATCKGRHPELYEQCRAYAREYGGARWRRSARRLRDELISKCVRTWRRTVPFAEPHQLFPEPSPVHFGLEWKRCFPQGMSGLPREAPATNHDALAPDHEATVSVIIPTYNRSGLLPRALDSVLTQTYKDLEVLVVDDASTDDTSEVVAAYGSDPRVRYLPQKDNRGVSAARNRGLAEARGQFIAFLDSDDEWLPPKLERQMRRFRKLSDRVGLIYVGGTMVYEESTERAQRPVHRGDVYDQLLVENFIYPTSGVIIRRNVVDEVGFFDEQIPANEDWDYWLRVARQFEIDSLEGQLVRYFAGHRRDRKSLVAQDDLDARARLYQKHLIEMRRTRSAFPFLMESVRRHLVPSSWNPAAARHLLWKAIPHRPWAPEVYMKFVRSLLPRSVYLLLREKWRGLRRFSVRSVQSSV